MPEPDQRSDDDLIEAINAGDEAAFEALYRRYRDWVYRLSYRFTRNEADALDVLQDTFAYLLRKFPGFVLTAKLTTLLYWVVKSLAISRQRRGRAVDLPDFAAESAADDPPSEDLVRDDLAAMMRILPPAQRETLLMRFVDDMTLQEIADALEIPLGTVKSRLHHALATLRNNENTKRYFDP